MPPSTESHDEIEALLQAAVRDDPAGVAERLVREFERRHGAVISLPDDLHLLRIWAVKGEPMELVQEIALEFLGVPLCVTCTSTVEMGTVRHRVDYALRGLEVTSTRQEREGQAVGSAIVTQTGDC